MFYLIYLLQGNEFQHNFSVNSLRKIPCSFNRRPVLFILMQLISTQINCNCPQSREQENVSIPVKLKKIRSAQHVGHLQPLSKSVASLTYSCTFRKRELFYILKKNVWYQLQLYLCSSIEMDNCLAKALCGLCLSRILKCS